MEYDLTYSIYYNKNEWNKLISNIYLMLNNYKKISKFYLNLSILRGPHVELTTTVSKEHARDSVKYFSNYINNFLQSTPSSNNNLETETHELFSDLPNNTVHYGVHDYMYFFEINLGKGMQFKDDNYQIALIIIEIYKDNDKETPYLINEIVFQLLAIYCLAFTNELKHLITFSEELYRNEFEKHNVQLTEAQLELSLENFENNKEDIINYLSDVLIKKTIVPISDWEKRWYSLISNSILKEKDVEIEKNHEFLINTICFNLDFKNKIDVYSMFLMGLRNI